MVSVRRNLGFAVWIVSCGLLQAGAVPVQVGEPLQGVGANAPARLRGELVDLRTQIRQIQRDQARQVKRLQARLRELETHTAASSQPVPSHSSAPQGPRSGRPRSTGPILSGIVRVEAQENVPSDPSRSNQAPEGQNPSDDLSSQIEKETESLLEQGEAGRNEPAPELGAGLGARLSALNPNISVIGDFLGVLSDAPESFDGGHSLPLAGFEEGDVDGFAMREIEIMMSAAIDPYADGLLKLAIGESVEIEEGYALFHDYPFRERLPEWLRDVHTKVGVFRMAFGPLNLVDDHDLPTIDRPLAAQRFLDEEGLIRPGVSFSKSLPLTEAMVSELTVEFANGEPLGGEAGAPPFAGIDHPLGLVHYKVFFSSQPATGWEERLKRTGRLRLRDGERTTEIGATFAATGNRAAGGEDLFSLVQGFDVTWQWYDPRPDAYRQYLLQSELFTSQLDQAGDGVRGDVGGYLLGQVRLTKNWFSGLRFDITEFPDRDGFQLAASPYLSFWLTEFNRFRIQYQYLRQELEGEGTENVHSVLAQLVFVFGAHPPEPYYISQRF